jgi:hypothetical protein
MKAAGKGVIRIERQCLTTISWLNATVRQKVRARISPYGSVQLMQAMIIGSNPQAARFRTSIV